MRGTEKLVFVWDEAALFQRDAEVRGLLVRDDRAGGHDWLSGLSDHFVERDGVRAGQINQAVQRCRHRDVGQGCGHVIGNDGLHKGSGFPAQLL